MEILGKNNIVGNEKLCARLVSDIKSGSLAHAYIIEGKKGSGRHTLAKNILAALACTEGGASLPCGECKNCRDILEDKCPDVMTIGREGKASLGIDAVRAIKSTIMAVANNLDFKAYIFEDADTMTLQAQNALLLTLEQPPTRVYFFIICENARSLLETIRSRAPILRTEPLSSQAVDAYITSERVDKSISSEARTLKSSSPEEYETLLFTADGSIGRAVELLSTKNRKPITDARSLAMRFLSSVKGSSASEHPLMLLPTFSQKRDELIFQLAYVSTALRDLILLKKSDSVQLCFFTNRDEALELSSTFAERRLISLFDRVNAAAAGLDANANVRLTMIELMSGM